MSDNTILFSKYIFNFFCRNTAVERFLHIIDQKRHHRNRLYPMIGPYADLTLISMQKKCCRTDYFVRQLLYFALL